MKRAKTNKNKNRYSGLEKHARQKSALIAPINQLPAHPIDWERDLLPEHLWLEMLFHTYFEASALKLYREFVASLDPYCPEDKVVFGYISDFGVIPLDCRQKYLGENQDLVERAFRKPIGGIMSLYPEAPCAWLLDPANEVDEQLEVKRVTESIVRLLPGKDLHAGHVRVVPFNQVLKEGKFLLRKGMRVLDLLPKYRNGCSEEEQYELQQHVRMFMNMKLQQLEHHKEHKWAKHFWRRNLDLVKCRPIYLPPKGGEQVLPEQMDKIQQLVLQNAERACHYLDKIAEMHHYDLYDPSRDEVLLGLFGRVTRLFEMAMTGPPLWAPDMSGIMLRCMADTAITFAYLLKAGSLEDFASFISYGKGKEKLLMLHLQDRYVKEKTIEGSTAEDVAKGLGGGFTPEMINIELTGWTKKSARDLALAAGMDDIYRLVYDPASSHLHGTWMSIDKSNLINCAQPMHRFHKLPACFEAPLFVGVVNAFTRIYDATVAVGLEKLNFPCLEEPMVRIDGTTHQGASKQGDAPAG